ncbi:MAG: hypothetical protein JO071_06615 [Deltaproteobacteria bacterium]|nr:hypothetical protein [Deltaproteobacteria bacterium]
MMRQFDFEAEVYESLSCVPMAARRKLDRLGLKISLEQWQRLSRSERLMICHAPASMPDECEVLRSFIDEVTVARSGLPPRPLSDESRKEAEPAAQPPPALVANASKLGVVLSAREWERLDDDERYALIKLGGLTQPSHNFKAALHELLASPQR